MNFLLVRDKNHVAQDTSQVMGAFLVTVPPLQIWLIDSSSWGIMAMYDNARVGIRIKM